MIQMWWLPLPISFCNKSVSLFDLSGRWDNIDIPGSGNEFLPPLLLLLSILNFDEWILPTFSFNRKFHLVWPQLWSQINKRVSRMLTFGVQEMICVQIWTRYINVIFCGTLRNAKLQIPKWVCEVHQNEWWWTKNGHEFELKHK